MISNVQNTCAMKKTGLSSILLALTLLTVFVIAEAQQPKKCRG